MHAYAPRPIRSLGLREYEGWRLKLYSIVYGGATLDEPGFAPGLGMALRALPSPATAPGRLGLGFLIEHQARTAWYTVLCWWDQENELPVRVFVRPLEAHAVWRPARGGESICVGDLEVIGFERDAYVDSILSGTEPPDVAGYLEKHLTS